MNRSGGVRRRFATLVALGALVLALCGAATTAQPAQAQTGSGSISGRITDPSGNPLAGVTVTPWVGTTSFSVAATTTAADGTYTLSGAPSGVSDLFVGFTRAGYMPQWWNNKTCVTTADPVTVPDGQTVSGIDAVLQPVSTPTGSITGHVTDASMGCPVAGASVVATNTSTNQSTTTSADANGLYAFAGLSAGTYTVSFSAPTFANQWWNDRPSQAAADPITVTDGLTASGIDAALQPAPTTGSITGHVTLAGQGVLAVNFVTITATNTATGQSTTASPGADGAYTFSGLAPGSYTVEFQIMDFVDQWWNNKPSAQTADQVTVTAGQTVTGIDAALAPVPPGTISGTVTDRAGHPVGGATVTAGFSFGLGNASGSTTTAADGTYSLDVPPLPSGFGYSVSFSAPGYVTQWWSGTFFQSDATSAGVASGQTVSGVNAALDGYTATGVLTGTVSDITSQTVADATVVATNATTGEATTVQADASGNYAFTALAPGAYTVEFSAPSYANQWWNNKSSQATADQVTITAGQTTSNINANLAPSSPASISGRVTDGAGQPVPQTFVEAVCSSGQTVDTSTAADGTYTIGGLSAPTGTTCTVEFSASGYVIQYWNDRAAGFLVPVDPISISAGQTTTGIDAQLHRTVLQGVVGGPSGSVAGVTVVVHNYFGFTVAQTTTRADGTWSVGTLGGGVYRVEFRPPAGSGLVGQWYNNEPDGAHSDGVGVAPGPDATTLITSLTTGAAVSGTVSDTAGPVSGATVHVFTTSASNQPAAEIAHTTTAADGSYSISGLQAGNYDVLFDPPAGSADVGQWFNNSSTAGGATNITLAASGTATANAQLTTGQPASISGAVTDQSGNPVAGTTVFAIAPDGTFASATSAADGTYTIDNVDVGIDTVWFLPPAGSNFGGSVWNLAVGKVVPVTVDQGAAITGIDATLAPNGT